MRNGHLTPDALASLAASGGEDPTHVLSCPDCREGLTTMRDLVAGLRALPNPPARLVDAAKTYFRTRRRLEDLIGRLLEDPVLRARAGVKPEAVLKDAGLEPTPELIEALRGREVSRDLAQRLAAKSFFA